MQVALTPEGRTDRKEDPRCTFRPTSGSNAPYVALAAYVVSLVKNAIDQDSRITNLIKILIVLAAITVVLAIAVWLLSGDLARLPAGASWGSPSGARRFVSAASIVSSVIRRCRIQAAAAGRVRRVVRRVTNGAYWPLAVSARSPTSSLTPAAESRRRGRVATRASRPGGSGTRANPGANSRGFRQA